MDKAPDFSQNLDPSKFQVSDTAGFKGQADAITKGTDSIQYDWSKVDSAVGQLSGLSDYFSTAAKGGAGATAGQQARMQQDNLGEAPQTAADLGKALMRMSKGGTAQAAGEQQAQSQQSMAFAKQAQQMKEAIVQTQMGKMKSDLQLQDTKFQIDRAMQKGKDGLDLANLSLKNMLNYGLATAKNAKALDDLAAQKANMDQVFAFIGAGLGAGSAIAAGIAGSPGSADPTATGADGNSQLGYQGNDPSGPVYGGITSTGGTGTYGGTGMDTSGLTTGGGSDLSKFFNSGEATGGHFGGA